MSLSIYFGNNIQTLAERLAESVAQSSKDCDLFEALPIIVPNENLSRWLQFTLARINGIAMNLEFPFFEKGLWELTLPLIEQDTPIIKLTDEVLQEATACEILRSVDDETISHIFNYCKNQQHEFDLSDQDCVRRLWQISCKLAMLFREYEYHREEMIGNWMTKGPADDSSAMEKAQQALYVRLFRAEDGLLAQKAPNMLSLFQLAQMLFKQKAKPTSTGRQTPIHFFGLSQLSRFHCHLLHKLAEFYDLRLYHFNVCTEFWEDVETPGEKRWQAVKDAKITLVDKDSEELELSIENSLLSAWGKAGRETVKLLADLEEAGPCVVEWLDEEPAAEDHPPILHEVQRGIRLRISKLTPCKQDNSLQIMGCPGIYREVEMVYDSILADMLQDDTLKHEPEESLKTYAVNDKKLKLSDIAILVPDMKTYRPAIASIFESRNELNYNLIDSSAAEVSVYAAALLKMLDLAGSSFTRKDMFELLFNPCFMAGNGLPRQDVDQWLAWADALGIFHSFDQKHRKKEGLLDGEQFTWQQALRRIRLGRISTPQHDAASKPETTAFDRYPIYEDMQTSGYVANRFSELIERLYYRLSPMANEQCTCKKWTERIESLMDDFLGIPADYVPEAYIQKCMVETLRSMAGETKAPGLDELMDKAKTGNEISLALVHQILKNSLASIPSSKGRYLVDGVTIAALLPMRPIPFKVVYILGLNEGQFPGQVDRSTLDLRQARRRIGDVSRPDAGQYIFLESLMTVSDKLCLSYVNLDLQKDEQKFPCALLKQLSHFIEEHILPVDHEEKKSFKEVHVPFSAGSTISALPENKIWPQIVSDYNIGTFRVEPRLLAAMQTAPPAPAWLDCLSKYAEQHPRTTLSRRIERFLSSREECAEENLHQSPIPDQTSQDTPVQINIKDLAKFLEDPVEAFVQYHLGIYAHDEDAEAAVAEDEPISSQFPTDYNLQVLAMETYFQSGKNSQLTKHIFNAAYKKQQRASQCPEAVYGSLDQYRLWNKKIADLINDCWQYVPDEWGCAQMVSIGHCRHYEQSPDQELPEPLKLEQVTLHDNRRVDIELSGSQDIVWLPDADNNIRILAKKMSSLKPFKDLPSKHILQPFLFGLIYTLHTAQSDNLFFEVGLPTSSKGPRWYCYSLSTDEASSYLRNLIADYLDHTKIDLLPYAIIKDMTADEITSEAIEQALMEAKVADDSFGKPYKPKGIAALLIDDLKVPDNAAELVERRLSIIWNENQNGGQE